MKDPTTCTWLDATRARPGPRSSWCSSSRTWALRSLCRRSDAGLIRSGAQNGSSGRGGLSLTQKHFHTKGRLTMVNSTSATPSTGGGTTAPRSTLKIVVIGGTGLIGSKLVAKLGEHGYEAVAAAPNTGVNTLTGEGLAEALRGASVVVDVSNSPSFEDAAVLNFFETSTGNLLDVEAREGVGHHVILSVVGTERL